MMKKILYVAAVAVLLLAVVFLAVFSRRDAGTAGVGGSADVPRLRIVTTLFPLYDMARSIGGDDAEVTLLLPPGVSPHAFEPTPRDMAAIEESDLFVYTGDFMEPWAERTVSGLGLGSDRVVDASEGVEFLTMAGHEEEEHEAHTGAEEDAETHDGHDHDASGNDPHIWLDFDNATRMASRIAEAMSDADPDRAARYAERTADYAIRLSELDEAYRAGLEGCETHTVVYGGHYAFGYLAHRYDLEYEAAQGFSPDAEPSASGLSALVEQVRSRGLSHIFSETLGSPKIAETVARETGAEVLELNPAGNLPKDAFENGTTFFDIMESNLEKLEIGLGCDEGSKAE